MKTKLLVVGLLALLSGNAFSQSNSMTVVVKNVKEATGKIAIALYNKDGDFMKKSIARQMTQAKAGEVQLILENVTPGDYAISVMHDANDNGELDSGAFGIPKEGFGFSNDAMGMFGPPSYEKAKFNFTGTDKVAITLKYM